MSRCQIVVRLTEDEGCLAGCKRSTGTATLGTAVLDAGLGMAFARSAYVEFRNEDFNESYSCGIRASLRVLAEI